MAKGKGKKSKRKKKIGHSEAKTKKVKASEVTLIKSAPPAPLTDANVTTTGSESKNNVGTSLDKEKKNGQPKRLSGYIFMCNSTTKLDCYQYRVFGLSLGRKDMVEQIIPGIKLFLFDFEVKLLYGVYEATCTGKLNLEPGAFKGKFPAQVSMTLFSTHQNIFIADATWNLAINRHMIYVFVGSSYVEFHLICSLTLLNLAFQFVCVYYASAKILTENDNLRILLIIIIFFYVTYSEYHHTITIFVSYLSI